jgi:hypothetical protein
MTTFRPPTLYSIDPEGKVSKIAEYHTDPKENLRNLIQNNPTETGPAYLDSTSRMRYG